jgi:hypothetical protein
LPEKDTFNMKSVFTAIASGTFAIQLISLLIVLGEGVMYLLMITGLYDLLLPNTDLLILALLLGGGVTFLVFIAFLGFFLRSHKSVRNFIIGKESERIETSTPATKTILLLFGGAVLFTLLFGVYAYYLFWKYWLNPMGQSFLLTYGLTGDLLFEWGLVTAYFALGAIITCLILQILSAAINRYTSRLVKSIAD